MNVNVRKFRIDGMLPGRCLERELGYFRKGGIDFVRIRPGVIIDELNFSVEEMREAGVVLTELAPAQT